VIESAAHANGLVKLKVVFSYNIHILLVEVSGILYEFPIDTIVYVLRYLNYCGGELAIRYR